MIVSWNWLKEYVRLDMPVETLTERLMMAGLKLACLAPELRGIDPQNITYYFRRVMVIPTAKASGMAVWRKSLFAMMHLNANLPAAYFGVPAAQFGQALAEQRIAAQDDTLDRVARVPAPPVQHAIEHGMDDEAARVRLDRILRERPALTETVGERLEGRHRSVDTTGVGDVAVVVERDVEVAAHQHAATFDALGEQVGQGLHSHGYRDLPTKATRSTSRLE